jgi:DNA-binding NtrC family response regulator
MRWAGRIGATAAADKPALLDQMVGRSHALTQLRGQLQRVAAVLAPVLIWGERQRQGAGGAGRAWHFAAAQRTVRRRSTAAPFRPR